GRPSTSDLPWRPMLMFGTVLDDDESADSSRVVDAAGHAAAVVYHALYERGGADAVDGLPGGKTWRTATEAVPVASRHLATHEGHLVAPNERDRAALAEAPGFIAGMTFTGTAAELRTRLDGFADAGVTEIA